jgi:hypothetical protein
VIVPGVVGVVLGVAMVLFPHHVAGLLNTLSPFAVDSTRIRIGGYATIGLGITFSIVALVIWTMESAPPSM